MAKKHKKLIRFWEQYEGTKINKGAMDEKKRLARIYNKHRAKSKA